MRLGDRRREVIELGVGEIAQIADRRRAVARQDIERIGQPVAAVLARIFRRRCDVAQTVDRELEGGIGHIVAAFARAGEEVGDVRIEPDVVTARRPQAERAVGALAREQPLDRLLDAPVDRRVEGEMCLAREIVDVEQRQRLARDLFRTAERIAVERGQKRRRVERARYADRDRHRSGALHKVAEHVVRQRDTLALGERPHGAASENLRCRPHAEHVVAVHGEAAGTAHADREVGSARRGRRQR